MQAVDFSLVFSFVVAFFEVAESSSVVELAEMVYAPVASLCEMSFNTFNINLKIHNLLIIGYNL